MRWIWVLLLGAGCQVVGDAEWKGVLDADGDGVPWQEDCDPSSPNINPNATDDVGDGIDQNCDGVDGTDEDGDGYASNASGGPDCNDEDEAINPDAIETCDGVDNDCDGLPEGSDAVDATTWYRDADGDGRGDPNQAETACDVPEGYVANSQDCNDTVAAAWTGATDDTVDGVDQDCNGFDGSDVDGDGYASVASGGADCDDMDSGISPGASDNSIDGIDQNCDGTDGYLDSACESPNLSMVLIPNGTFTMGSPEDEWGWVSDETQHEVTLTHEFCVAVTELNQAGYTMLIGDNPSHFDACGDNCPVDNVTWHMAAAYANALSDSEGLDECYHCTGVGTGTDCSSTANPYACEGYRLPTEAEWEYSARGGLAEEAFPNGGSLADEESESDCSPDLVLSDGTLLADQAWFCGDSEDETHEVGLLDANGYGLYDMSGNVWEWSNDIYGRYGGDDIDPTGAVSGTRRVHLGGSWYNDPVDVRVANRGNDVPNYHSIYFGFRVVRSLP